MLIQNLIYNKRKEITMEKGTLLDARGKIIPPPKSKDETKPFILVDGGLHLKKEIRTEILRRMKESSNSAILDLTMLDDKQKEELKEFEDNLLVYNMDVITSEQASEFLANKNKYIKEIKPRKRKLKGTGGLKMEKKTKKIKLPSEKELKKQMIAENKRRDFVEKNKGKIIHG